MKSGRIRREEEEGREEEANLTKRSLD